MGGRRAKPRRRHANSSRSEEHTSELQSRRDLVCRLLLEKKTAAGAVWLEPARPIAYRFYPGWIRTEYSDVARHLKDFTVLSQDEIATLEKHHAENPGSRASNKDLAKAVTDLVHGSGATADAMRASDILFCGDLAGISESTFNEIVRELPIFFFTNAAFTGAYTLSLHDALPI